VSGFLLDTDAVLRLSFKSATVRPAAIQRLGPAQRHVSLVSGIEMAIKRSIGKLPLPPAFDISFAYGFEDTVRQLGAETLTLRLSHIELLAGLPLIHRDPFDRLLIAQALAEDLTIVSGDRKFAGYPGLDVLEI
jgi:PIN domain nuclease of toxin-antitoxin system